MAPIIKLAGVPITAGFGVVDSLHKTPHTGIDLATPIGTQIMSIGNGLVEKVIDYGSLNAGKTVVIQQDNGLRVVYGHLSEFKVKLNQHVEEGQVIALSGNSGNSTGPHLHLSVQKAGEYIDPTPYAQNIFESNNHWIPDFVEVPFKKLTESVDNLNHKIETISYWINPKNLATELWNVFGHLISSPETGYLLAAGTIIGIWLIMLGAKWPKKWIFWSWVIYWVFRGFIFV